MTLEFVWITDTHIIENIGQRSTSLRTACDYADSGSFDYIINTGDIGNDSADNTAHAMSIINAASTPLLWCNGNHSEEEDPAGTPSTTAFEAASIWNMSAPFYHTSQITGSGGEKVRVISMDCQFYADDPVGSEDSPNHDPGDRIGYHGSTPSGGYHRQFGATQIAWVASTLSGDSTSDYILVLSHYPLNESKMTDYVDLLDALQDDSRPALLLGGHAHSNAKVLTLNTTDALDTYTMYKAPALQESGSFVDLALGWSGSAITITRMIVRNFYQPGGWTFESPFTLEDTVMVMVV